MNDEALELLFSYDGGESLPINILFKAMFEKKRDCIVLLPDCLSAARAFILVSDLLKMKGYQFSARDFRIDFGEELRISFCILDDNPDSWLSFGGYSRDTRFIVVKGCYLCFESLAYLSTRGEVCFISD